jgi:hypothetical protein
MRRRWRGRESRQTDEEGKRKDHHSCTRVRESVQSWNIQISNWTKGNKKNVWV